MRVFVDTSYFTSSLVVNEVASLLQARSYLSPALTYLEWVRRSDEVQIIHPDAALQAEAWDLFGRWAGGGAKAVDCVSLAIMRQLGIRKAFTFDARFRAPGFEILAVGSKK
jgi:predicted nucleic acid-binding protein